ncbi:RING finger protein ETP1 homolog isoform X2 [Rosa chinensis]|uniref:RING finger protein ETP1 homolog isoform X2 n=1 Tax=Rosa chinensis TaxID=74649 RepID=UPI001AD8E65B|nr:RING finger protein ETP1 homolog isoform X2 [Rosa chinensis]
MTQTQCAHSLAFISCDPTVVPNPDTPCKRCQHPGPKGNWFCLSCKDIFCCTSVNGHFRQHYEKTKHCLCVNCSTKSIYCCSCSKTLDAQVIQQLWIKSFVGQDKLALAKEGLQKIFDNGLIAVGDPKVQEKFLLYSATLLSAESCPSELKVNLSSFRCNLPEETSTFIKAQDELKVASDLSASITQKKFVVRQQTSKYDEVKKEIVASDEKVSNFKAMIKELKAQIKRLEACLATEKSNRAKNNEAIDSIEKQVTTARDGLVSDLAQVSSMEGSTQAAKELVARKQSDWDNLKLSFTKFA